MPIQDPTPELHPQFSSPGAHPTPWAEVRTGLESAQMYWLATVRPDGRPHVTPLRCVWRAPSLYFCTGNYERKAKNLARNSQCVITTGCNVLDGVDMVVEGDALRVTDTDMLQQLAALYASKYGWQYTVRDGAFHHEGGRAEVYEVRPKTAFGFRKGEESSQTRFRF